MTKRLKHCGVLLMIPIPISNSENSSANFQYLVKRIESLEKRLKKTEGALAVLIVEGVV